MLQFSTKETERKKIDGGYLAWECNLNFSYQILRYYFLVTRAVRLALANKKQVDHRSVFHQKIICPNSIEVRVLENVHQQRTMKLQIETLRMNENFT